MSRTIRRLRDKPNNFSGFSNREKWYTHSWEWVPVDDEHVRLQWIKKEGDELKRAWWKYHNDTIRCASYPKKWRNTEERIYRAKNRQELHKFSKDWDYEVIDQGRPCLSWYY